LGASRGQGSSSQVAAGGAVDESFPEEDVASCSYLQPFQNAAASADASLCQLVTSGVRAYHTVVPRTCHDAFWEET
jgi:hypothetical protein